MTTLNIGTHTIANNDHLTQQVHLTVKNDKRLLDIFLSGLFVSTRRYLGFSPKASSSPLMTTRYSPTLSPTVAERKNLFWGMKCHTVAGPEVAKKKTNHNKHYLTMTMERSFVGTVCNTINQTLDMDDRFTNDDIHREAVCEALISEYWDDMLEYAKHHTQFHPQWQDVALTA
jgi:hypothetical protein